jgi:hypothetical protein
MGLFLRQNEERSKLQTRLAEELREKTRASQQISGEKPPEVEPELLANEHQTRPAGMLILIICFGIMVASIIWLVSSF